MLSGVKDLLEEQNALISDLDSRTQPVRLNVPTQATQKDQQRFDGSALESELQDILHSIAIHNRVIKDITDSIRL